MECSLSQDDIQTIESALISDLLSDSLHGLQTVEAAILISQGRFFYKRLVEKNPSVYRYKCLSPEALRVAFNTATLDSGWLPNGVVRSGSSVRGSWAVLFIAPRQHFLRLDDVGLITVPLPGLVLIGLERDYRLCAIADEEFNPTALCYAPPLPNVYTPSLKICWGSNTPPAATGQTIAQAWELFTASPFSNHLGNGKSTHKTFKADIVQQLLQLHRSQRKTYPVKTLVPILTSDRKHASVNHLVQEFLSNEC